MVQPEIKKAGFHLIKSKGDDFLATFWDKEELLGKISKNNREEIHIKQVTKNDKEYIDIRTFWYDSNEDTFKPSQKGLAIPKDAFAELKEILEKVD